MDNEIECSACNEEMYIEEFIEAGDIIVCPECGEEYMVKKTKPLKLITLIEEDGIEEI